MTEVRELQKSESKSRSASLAQLEREAKAKDDWPYGDKVVCLMRIAPGNPGSGFSTPQVIDLRNGVCLNKSKGWTVISRKAWNQLKNYRLRQTSPVVTEHKDLPIAKTLTQIKEEFPIVVDEEPIVELEEPAAVPVVDVVPMTVTDFDPTSPEISGAAPRKGGLRRKKSG